MLHAGTMCRKMLQLRLWPVEFGCWGQWSEKEAARSLYSWITDGRGDVSLAFPCPWYFPDKHSCGQPLAAMHLLPVFSVPFCHRCSRWSCLLTWKSGSVFDTFGEEKSITNCCNNQSPCCSKESSSVFSTFLYNLLYPGFEMPVSSSLTKKKFFFLISKVPEVPN